MYPWIDFIMDEISQYILLFNGFLSIIVNLFAVHVIVNRSTKHMVEYKWLLLHVTLASAFTDVFISVLLVPIPISNGVGTIMYGILGKLFPSQGRLFCILLNVSVGYMMWANLLCFVYRLYLLTTIQYRWMHKYLCLLIMLSFTSTIISTLLYMPALASEEEVRSYARRVVYLRCLSNTRSDELNLTSEGTALWLIIPKNFAHNSRWGTFCITQIVCHYLLFAVITIIAYRILNNIGSGERKSVIVNHRMLFRSLILQTSIPFLTFVFPVFITGLAQKLKQSPDTIRYARLCSVPGILMLSSYSLSHVAVMLMCTTPYKNYCINIFNQLCCCRLEVITQTFSFFSNSKDNFEVLKKSDSREQNNALDVLL